MFLLYIVITFSIFFIIWGYRDYQKKDFEKKKLEITNMYSALISDINTDYSHDKLHAKSIRDISISITNLTDKIEQISKNREMKIHRNGEWIFNLMSEYRKNIQLWIHYHTTKLSSQSEVMEKMESTENSIAPVQLAKQRIDHQIHLYSKI